MKKLYLVSILILAVCMLFVPLAAGGVQSGAEGLPAMGKDTEVFLPTDGKAETIKVYRSESGKTEEMSVEDYLFCVVAAEMPALYENEALKAQTVAAYTYALKKAASSDKDYDITDDYSVDQAFVTVEAAREKWGSNADTYEQKIRSAISAVLYEKITYDSEPILAAYHAISSGKTENAADIWGGNYAYLTAVDSEGDKLSPDYMSSVTFSPDELARKLSGLVETGGDAASWIGEISRTGSGSVITAVICGKAVAGDKIRSALSLRSANFEIAYADGAFTFTVKGYGHGIGMSQYGAHYMAMQGKTYKEILLHYYSGCKIE